jgi:prepilin-type N-terminal cleavage/methylation domain-containing protein
MRKERGFTLVELSIVVIIMGIMATIGVWSKMQELRDELAKSQGQQLVRLNDAIGTYMVNNYAALVNGSPIGGVANTMSPTVAELRTLGILDAGFSANNLYGGGYTTALTLVPAACAPPNCNISSLVYLTTQIIDPNTGRVDGPRLGVAQGVAGGDAAYSLPATPAVFTGSGGGWTAVNPLNTAGILAMRNGTGSSAWAQFLRRDGSLPMTGNLDMGGQAINNAATIALNTVVANGAACATNGVVARDANGAVMSCQSGAWRSQGSAFWQDPVVNAASLPACNASSIWQTRVVEIPTVGSGPRAYTCNGASWQALAVNDAGNITIPGLMTAANATITGATTTNQLAGNLEVTVTATVNTACSPNGRIARDANGLLLSCQSGVWKKASGDGGKVLQSDQLSAYNNSVAVCNTYPVGEFLRTGYYGGSPFTQIAYFQFSSGYLMAYGLIYGTGIWTWSYLATTRSGVTGAGYVTLGAAPFSVESGWTGAYPVADLPVTVTPTGIFFSGSFCPWIS